MILIQAVLLLLFSIKSEMEHTSYQYVSYCKSEQTMVPLSIRNCRITPDEHPNNSFLLNLAKLLVLNNNFLLRLQISHDFFIGVNLA